jgi:hypothetical protein
LPCFFKIIFLGGGVNAELVLRLLVALVFVVALAAAFLLFRRRRYPVPFVGSKICGIVGKSIDERRRGGILMLRSCWPVETCITLFLCLLRSSFVCLFCLMLAPLFFCWMFA